MKKLIKIIPILFLLTFNFCRAQDITFSDRNIVGAINNLKSAMSSNSRSLSTDSISLKINGKEFAKLLMRETRGLQSGNYKE